MTSSRREITCANKQTMHRRILLYACIAINHDLCTGHLSASGKIGYTHVRLKPRCGHIHYK